MATPADRVTETRSRPAGQLPARSAQVHVQQCLSAAPAAVAKAALVHVDPCPFRHSAATAEIRDTGHVEASTAMRWAMLTVLLALSLLAVAAMPLAAGDEAADAKPAAAAPAQDGTQDSVHARHDGRRKGRREGRRHTHNATAAHEDHGRRRKWRDRHNATAAGTHSQKSALYGGFAQ